MNPTVAITLLLVLAVLGQSNAGLIITGSLSGNDGSGRVAGVGIGLGVGGDVNDHGIAGNGTGVQIGAGYEPVPPS